MGIDSEHETGLEAAQIAQELGVAAVTVHARTQTQHYAGQAHWEYIARVKEALDIPVFGNGDVFEAADAIAMMRQTGCDGISVGRGAQGVRGFSAYRRRLPRAAGLRGPFTSRGCCHHRNPRALVRGRRRRRGPRDARNAQTHRLVPAWFKVGGPQRHALGMVSTLDELSERLADLDLDQDFPRRARASWARWGEKTPHLPDGWLEHRYLTDAERASIHHAEVGY